MRNTIKFDIFGFHDKVEYVYCYRRRTIETDQTGNITFLIQYTAHSM